MKVRGGQVRGGRCQHPCSLAEVNHTPRHSVTIIGSLAVICDDRHRIAAVAVITEGYAPRAISRAHDTDA